MLGRSVLLPKRFERALIANTRLGLEIKDDGFDASVLTEFSARLTKERTAQLLFDRLLTRLQNADVRPASKREQEWHGYKVHLTETVVEDNVQLITNVYTTAATLTDKEALPEIQAGLAEQELLPETQILDAGYITAEQLVESCNKYQIDLLGPLSRDPSWQAKAGKGFAGGDFKIDWDNKRATCPRGKQSAGWRLARADYGMDIVYIDFLKSDCSACPVRSDCTKSKTERRTLTVNAQPFYEAMQQNRKRQETAEFK